MSGGRHGPTLWLVVPLVKETALMGGVILTDRAATVGVGGL